MKKAKILFLITIISVSYLVVLGAGIQIGKSNAAVELKNKIKEAQTIVRWYNQKEISIASFLFEHKICEEYFIDPWKDFIRERKAGVEEVDYGNKPG